MRVLPFVCFLVLFGYLGQAHGQNALVLKTLPHYHIGGGQGVRGVRDAKSCIRRCHVTSGCIAVDFHPGKRACWLHGPRSGCFIPTRLKTTNHYRLINCEPATKMPFRGIALNITTEAKCVDACKKNTECLAVDFNMRPGQENCWMYNKFTACSKEPVVFRRYKYFTKVNCDTMTPPPTTTTTTVTTTTVTTTPTTTTTTTTAKPTTTMSLQALNNQRDSGARKYGVLGVYRNAHVHGGKLEPHITTLDECLRLCGGKGRGKSRCRAVDFDSRDDTCWLHYETSMCVKLEHSDTSTHYKFALCEENRRVSGGSIYSLGKTLGECVDACASMVPCKSIDFNMADQSCTIHGLADACRPRVPANGFKHVQLTGCGDDFIIRDLAEEKRALTKVPIQAQKEKAGFSRSAYSHIPPASPWSHESVKVPDGLSVVKKVKSNYKSPSSSTGIKDYYQYYQANLKGNNPFQNNPSKVPTTARTRTPIPSAYLQSVRNSGDTGSTSGVTQEVEPTASLQTSVETDKPEEAEEVKPTEAAIQQPLSTADTPSILYNYQVKGGTMMRGVKTFQMCFELCKNHPICKAMDFNFEHGQCYIHTTLDTACSVPEPLKNRVHLKAVPCSG